MAKIVLDLKYGVGRSFLTGHITRLGSDSYRAFLEENSKITARRDLNREEFKTFLYQLWDYCEENPEYDFDSIWPFHHFVVDGEFPQQRSERLRRERDDGYRPGRQAMRSRFSLAKPSLNWQWDNSDWNALMADDFLEDHAGSDCHLPRWAVTACGLLERDLTLGNVVFNSDIGLVVHHEEIEGCTASILYQRPGQLEDVRSADRRQER